MLKKQLAIDAWESYSNILKENWGKIKIALDDLKLQIFVKEENSLSF